MKFGPATYQEFGPAPSWGNFASDLADIIFRESALKIKVESFEDRNEFLEIHFDFVSDYIIVDEGDEDVLFFWETAIAGNNHIVYKILKNGYFCRKSQLANKLPPRFDNEWLIKSQLDCAIILSAKSPKINYHKNILYH